MSTIAFLGTGAMGEALVRGLLRAGVYQPAEIAAFDAHVAKAEKLAAELEIRACATPAAVIEGADLLLVAVKPQVIEAALAPLRGLMKPSQSVVSIAAGVATARLEACFDQPIPCVRVMPNTAALIGRGAAAICLGRHAGPAQREAAHRIFDAVGLAVDVEEKLLDAVTGLSGSGPAYVYVFIEALGDAGVEMGLARDVATRLAAQTVAGAAAMVLETGTHPGQLKDFVTSPGGTTIAGLHALERAGFRAAVMDAVEAATRRSRELSGG